MRSLVAPLVGGALLAVTPRIAIGQNDGLIRFDARPGTEIPSDQLGDILANSIAVSYPGQVLRTTLRVEMISREQGVVARYESEAVENPESDRWYPGTRWLPIPPLTDALGSGLGDGRTITLGRAVLRPTVRRIPRECDDATHAVVLTLLSADRTDTVDSLAVCLFAES